MHKYALMASSTIIMFCIVACSPTITTIDELTEAAESLPTAQPTSTLIPATPTLNPSEAREQGQRALEQQDYVNAVVLLRSVYETDSTNDSTAILLAEAYAGLGTTLIQQAQGDLTTIQEAFDALTAGLEVAPEGTQVRMRLAEDHQAAQTLLEVVTTLAELTEQQSERSGMLDQRELANDLIRKIKQGAELHTDFFTVANLPSAPIEEAATLQETYASQFSAEERRQFWETALALRALIETT